MKILCLILASDTAPEYIRFQALWRRILTINPNVDCLFYKGHPDIAGEAFMEDSTIWIPIHEGLDTVYEKTLQAFKFVVPDLHKYTFVFRSNLSTFISFPHLVEFCKDLPSTECCAGVIGGIPRSDIERYSLNHDFSFPAGNGFLLSSDLVRRLVEEPEPRVEQDDVTIGVALRKWKIPIREFARPDFRDNGHWVINNSAMIAPNDMTLNPKKIMFSYRLKSFDRKRDAEMFSLLITTCYGV